MPEFSTQRFTDRDQSKNCFIKAILCKFPNCRSVKKTVFPEAAEETEPADIPAWGPLSLYGLAEVVPTWVPYEFA